jgi:hypothetical protein
MAPQIQKKLQKADLKTIKQHATDPQQFTSDEKEVCDAIKMFMESDVSGSERVLRGKCWESLLHCHGNGILFSGFWVFRAGVVVRVSDYVFILMYISIFNIIN